jgi:Spy/CpxP family protein refolding chaperone
MEKNRVTIGHIALFVISLLAVCVSATPYVKSYIAERQAPANGGGPGGGRGGGFNPQQMAARRLDQMTQELQLTPEQKTKIQAIQESSMPAIKAIFDDTTLTREQRREKMRPLRDETDAKIKQVLTPEQQTKYDAMQAQRRARFGGGGGGGGRGMRGGGGMDGPGGFNPPNSPAFNPPNAPNPSAPSS